MNKLVPPDDVKSVRPASAPAAHRVPFKPQFFWALRPEDVPDDMRSPKPGANYSPAYAHDPTSWLIHRHRDGHLCAESGQRNRAQMSCPVEQALKQPMGRPQSAPQILKERPTVRELREKKVKASRLNVSQSSPAICPEAETAKRLGYWPGQPRKEVKSLFPKQPESDLPLVIARMQKLQAEQKALMQNKGETQAVKLKKHRDVCG
mmetsp:Transcript_12065/g.14628  ORF Transcript_12065/g.14628 Transcript_12065/m.14628 type:complete len:206 (-) Transcript_12065:9-626(-)